MEFTEKTLSSKVAYDGKVVHVEFDEIETDEINIYLSSENTIYLNELMILGK